MGSDNRTADGCTQHRALHGDGVHDAEGPATGGAQGRRRDRGVGWCAMCRACRSVCGLAGLLRETGGCPWLHLTQSQK
eukprot:scaffold24868_cov101-Isochrysis_galbana.AAC.1